MSCSWNQRIAFFKDLIVTVVDYSNYKEKITFHCDFEPSFMSVGPKYVSLVKEMQIDYFEHHVVVRMDHDVSRYNYGATAPAVPIKFSKVYPFDVETCITNQSFSLVISIDGKSYLHPLNEEYLRNQSDLLEFPGGGTFIQGAHFTDNHLFYYSNGLLVVWDLEEMSEIINYQHPVNHFN